jgi:hypothetical protein
LHSTKWKDGNKKRDENYSPQKNNSIQDSVDKENGYPVYYLNKKMVRIIGSPVTPT